MSPDSRPSARTEYSPVDHAHATVVRRIDSEDAGDPTETAETQTDAAIAEAIDRAHDELGRGSFTVKRLHLSDPFRIEDAGGLFVSVTVILERDRT